MASKGLSTADADAYIKAHGYNEIAEHKQSLLRKIVKRSATPISGMLLVAALLSYAASKPFDGSFILVLLVLNIAITVWQEHKADTAIEKLNEHLAIAVRTLRDGAWQVLSARLLVPGDVIELKAGNVVPADARVSAANAASANEAAFTGESLPKEKKEGDLLYSGSFVASGLIIAEVTATGSNTNFGKTITKVDIEHRRSALEKDILRISRFLSILSLGTVVVLTWALWVNHAAPIEILRLDLSLIIAGIPISLPTVMTLIIAFGIIALARKQVVVRRLASLEELANTDLLLTDKTGTLTENKITVSSITAYGTFSENQVIALAALVAREDKDSVGNQAVLARAGAVEEVPALHYIPGDSTRKRSTLTRRAGSGEETLTLGAPQVVAGLCDLSASARATFDADVEALAKRGYRTMALAQAKGEKEEHMTLAGLIALSDVLRTDAKDVIHFLGENGIGSVMLTGDNRAIATEIAEQLSLPGKKIVARDPNTPAEWQLLTAEDFRTTRAFAEILPEDKYALVKSARRFFTVAVNGDGINDLPAVKEADVGFAVRNAVDALKGAADIVLLSDGIAVIRDAFIEGRQIFARLYSYSLYRISESFRLIVTIAILGLIAGTYPLSPLQLIVLALLNDIPIISLAFDRVKIANRPVKLHVIEQFSTSLLFGSVGVVNSLLLYFFAVGYLHVPLALVQTLFFLKLTVSGHLLIYVAHTKERWWRFLPSTPVIAATAATQAVATLLALTGLLMPSPISWQLVLFIWLWSFAFMQVTELVKFLRQTYQTMFSRSEPRHYPASARQ